MRGCRSSPVPGSSLRGSVRDTAGGLRCAQSSCRANLGVVGVVCRDVGLYVCGVGVCCCTGAQQVVEAPFDDCVKERQPVEKSPRMLLEVDQVEAPGKIPFKWAPDIEGVVESIVVVCWPYAVNLGMAGW